VGSPKKRYLPPTSISYHWLKKIKLDDPIRKEKEVYSRKPHLFFQFNISCNL
jgi:hypothetical protein